MHRGAVAVRPITCDRCASKIEYGKSYLILEENDKLERLCSACALKDHHAIYKTERGRKMITFLEPK